MRPVRVSLNVLGNGATAAACLVVWRPSMKGLEPVWRLRVEAPTPSEAATAMRARARWLGARRLAAVNKALLVCGL